MTALILYVLGFAITFISMGRDVLNADGTIKSALTGWVKWLGAAFWFAFAAVAVFDRVREWIVAKRNKA
ncbi:MAG: hypothetical protein [Bacteriophage sp.]|nr:MAG: hypothetical protein [Bacteriophage sp.]